MAKAEKKPTNIHDMDNVISAMKKHGLSDDEIDNIFTEMEDDAMKTIVKSLQLEDANEDLEPEVEKPEGNQDSQPDGDDPNSLHALINASINQEPAKLADIFDAQIKSRLATKVDEFKHNLAQTMFDPPPDPESEPEDDEPADDDDSEAADTDEPPEQPEVKEDDAGYDVKNQSKPAGYTQTKDIVTPEAWNNEPNEPLLKKLRDMIRTLSPGGGNVLQKD